MQQSNDVESLPKDAPSPTHPTKTEERRTLKRPRPQKSPEPPEDEQSATKQTTTTRSNSIHEDGNAASSPPHKRIRQASLTPQGDDHVITSLIPLFTFWLSAANLTKDRHLLRALTEDEDGWTPIETFTTFNKVRALTAQPNHLTTALLRLTDPKLELRTDASPAVFRLQGGLPKLRKHVGKALSDEDARTVFLTHVPSRTSRETIMNTFRTFGQIAYVSIPRGADGQCRGFAFVEFVHAGQAARVLSDWRRCASRCGLLRDVQVLPRREWARRKEARKKRARVSVARTDGMEDSVHAVNGRATEDVQEGEEVAGEAGADKSASDRKEDFEKGLVVHISGLQNATQNVTRASLYEQLEEYGPVSFVEFTPKQRDECTVRYMHCTGTERARASLMEEGVSLLGGRVKAKVLESEEESAYWQRIQEGRKQKSDRKAQKQRKRGSTKCSS